MRLEIDTVDKNSSAWSHLPNAKHIDRILIDLKQNPHVWAMAWDEAWGAVSGMAWDSARDTAWTTAAWDMAADAAWNAVRGMAWDSARDTAWTAAARARSAARARARGAAKDAILALVTYDRAGSYLGLDPNQVEMLAYLGDGIAILMYSAVIALSNHVVENN